jgi:hypothetical protein
MVKIRGNYVFRAERDRENDVFPAVKKNQKRLA